jgi:hypothetical protein
MRGHLDALTPGGFAEGWAFDPDAPATPLVVRLLDPAGAEVARGLAAHHRADLAGIGYRFGWCAFRLRLSMPAELLRDVPLTLLESNTGVILHAAARPAWQDRAALDSCTTVEAALAQDPTTLRNIRQLSGWGPGFAAFIERHGAQAFVRAAHLYVLGRPPESQRLALEERLLTSGAVTPFGLLSLLADVEEVRSGARRLASPIAPGFPFA